MIHLFYIAIGGFLGAISRYFCTNLIKRKNKFRLPLGTLFVNLIGSFLLGYLFGSTTEISLKLLFGTGFLGAFTTFSTFKLETIQLVETKERVTACINLVLTYGGGILFAFTGYLIGKI